MTTYSERLLTEVPAWQEQLSYLHYARGFDPVRAVRDGQEYLLPDTGYLISASVAVGGQRGNLSIKRYASPGLVTHMPVLDSDPDGILSSMIGSKGPALNFNIYHAGDFIHSDDAISVQSEQHPSPGYYGEIVDAIGYTFINAARVNQVNPDEVSFAGLVSDILGPEPAESAAAVFHALRLLGNNVLLNRAVATSEDAVAVLSAIGIGMGYAGDELTEFTSIMSTHVVSL